MAPMFAKALHLAVAVQRHPEPHPKRIAGDDREHSEKSHPGLDSDPARPAARALIAPFPDLTPAKAFSAPRLARSRSLAFPPASVAPTLCATGISPTSPVRIGDFGFGADPGNRLRRDCGLHGGKRRSAWSARRRHLKMRDKIDTDTPCAGACR